MTAFNYTVSHSASEDSARFNSLQEAVGWIANALCSGEVRGTGWQVSHREHLVCGICAITTCEGVKAAVHFSSVSKMLEHVEEVRLDSVARITT